MDLDEKTAIFSSLDLLHSLPSLSLRPSIAAPFGRAGDGTLCVDEGLTIPLKAIPRHPAFSSGKTQVEKKEYSRIIFETCFSPNLFKPNMFKDKPGEPAQLTRFSGIVGVGRGF